MPSTRVPFAGQVRLNLVALVAEDAFVVIAVALVAEVLGLGCALSLHAAGERERAGFGARQGVRFAVGGVGDHADFDRPARADLHGGGAGRKLHAGHADLQRSARDHRVRDRALRVGIFCRGLRFRRARSNPRRRWPRLSLPRRRAPLLARAPVRASSLVRVLQRVASSPRLHNPSQTAASNQRGRAIRMPCSLHRPVHESQSAVSARPRTRAALHRAASDLRASRARYAPWLGGDQHGRHAALAGRESAKRCSWHKDSPSSQMARYG